MRKLVGIAVAILSLMVVPRTAQAASLVGELDFDGSVRVTFEGMILWSPDAVIQNTSTGFFAQFAGGLVQETDLDSTVQMSGPVGTFTPLQNFETLDDASTLNFTLTAINPCSVGCQAGLGGPFNFIQIPNGTGGFNTTVILSMLGTLTDPVNNPGEVYNWSGTWSADFPNQTAADIVSQLSGPGTFIDAPYSAAKVTTFVPSEVPGAACSRALGVVAARRRRNQK